MDANKHFKDWYFSYDMEKYEGEPEEYSAKEMIDFAESYYEARTELKNNGGLGDVVEQSEQLCRCTDSHEFAETYEKEYCRKCDGLI